MRALATGPNVRFPKTTKMYIVGRDILLLRGLRMNIRLDEKIMLAIKRQAAKEGRTVTDLVSSLLRGYIEKTQYPSTGASNAPTED